MFDEIPLNRVEQTSLSRLSEEMLGRIDVKSWLDRETKDVVYKFTHTIYAREVDRIIIPSVKVKKNFIILVIQKVLTTVLPFIKISEERVIRDEIIIQFNQFFPKLVVPAGSKEPLYLAAAQILPEGQRAVGHSIAERERNLTSTKSHTRRETRLQVNLHEEKKPFWCWGKD